MKKKKFLLCSILVILLISFFVYLFFENTTLQVSNYIITNKEIPDNFDDFKIIQVSDYHNVKSERLNNRLILEISSQNPDIIVVTGDTIDARKSNVDTSIEFIKKLSSIAPIYLITGNHEGSSNRYNEFKTEILSSNVTILENTLITLEKDDDKINLLGILDPNFIHSYQKDNSDTIKKCIQDIDYDTNLYTILLSHRPEVFNTYVNEKIDLVFTGHAHGGQIRIPFTNGLYSPNQGIFPKYTNGVHEKEDTTMIVSRGIGNSNRFPFRINNNPELVIVELNIN